MEFFEIKRKIFEVEEKIGERSYRVSRNGKVFFLKDFENDYFHKRYAKNSLMEKLFNKMTADAGFIPKISTSETEWEDSVINDLNSVTTCSGGLAETFRGNIRADFREKRQLFCDMFDFPLPPSGIPSRQF